MGSGPKSKKPTDKVHFLQQSIFPCSIAFCMDAKAWERELKRIKLPVEMQQSLTAGFDGATHIIGDEGGSVTNIYVCINNDKGVTEDQMIGLMAHEATHAFDAIAESMNEAKPSAEFKAYTTQWLVSQFYNIWMDSKKKRRKK